MVVVLAARGEAVPGDVVSGTDDGETALVVLATADARAWLGHEATAKWALEAPDAMFVAVIGSGGGASVYRLTKR